MSVTVLFHEPVDSRAPAVPVDRRSRVRYPCRLWGACRPIENPETSSQWEVRVRDLSTNGLQLLLNRRFEPGTQLSVEVRSSDGGSHLVLARVRRLVKLAQKNWDLWTLGCSLETPLEDEEVETLVQDLC